MILSIIGSGNTANVLGKLLIEKGHIINEVVGKNTSAVENLAQTLNANDSFHLSDINKESDAYIIAVSDAAVAEVSAQLNFDDKIIIHTCGSVSINILSKTSSNYGVLYPLQSLRKELNYSPFIPFLIDGNNEYSKQQILQLANSLSTQVRLADDEIRLRYHLSATVVSNFSNHLFAVANDYCDKNNIDFNILLPLIEETINRMHFYKPALMQTGPAARGDELTIEKHLALLNNFPQLQRIYQVISDSIRKYSETIK